MSNDVEQHVLLALKQKLADRPRLHISSEEVASIGAEAPYPLSEAESLRLIKKLYREDRIIGKIITAKPDLREFWIEDVLL